MFKGYTRKFRLLLLAPLVLILVLACGDDNSPTATSSDSSSSDSGAETEETSSQPDGPVEMVPLSSLSLDLPFELSYDPPVPSDATVSNTLERQATDTTHAGYDLTFDTTATYEDIQATYDEYVSTFEFSSAFPDSQAWSGRRAEGEPSITIAIIGGRLNIAEILDN